MKPTIAQKYSTQAIDLQPYGNTISVEAASDNPFESDQDVEIYTQASGGMAGPDRRMRSRGLLVKRPTTRPGRNGKAMTYRVNQDAAHNGFFPGMGDLDGTGRRVRRTRMISRNGFMPGFGDLDGGPRRAMKRRAISHNGFFPGMGNVPAPASTTPAWLAALTGAASTAGGIVGQRYDAKTAASMAQAEQARADQMRAQALMASSLNLPGAGGGSSKTLMIGLGIAAAAVGVIFLLKRK